MNETVRRVKQNSLDEMARRLEMTDIGLRKLMEDKRALQMQRDCIFPQFKDKI